MRLDRTIITRSPIAEIHTRHEDLGSCDACFAHVVLADGTAFAFPSADTTEILQSVVPPGFSPVELATWNGHNSDVIGKRILAIFRKAGDCNPDDILFFAMENSIALVLCASSPASAVVGFHFRQWDDFMHADCVDFWDASLRFERWIENR